jgi:hypothetical protein
MKTFRSLVPILLFLALPALLLAQRPVSGELQVNVDTAEQQIPRVATNRSGGFVVTWVRYDIDGTFVHRSLHAARFNADGTAATGEILVSDENNYLDMSSAAVLMDDGSFAVAFMSAEGLVARWYTPGGSPDGADVLVTRTLLNQFSVSTGGDGGRVVAWHGGEPGVWFRVLRPDHSSGPETLVDAAGADPAVAVGPQGGFVMAWRQRQSQIVARRFTSLGAPSGRRFVVDPVDSVAGTGGHLHIGKEEDGDFLVLWGFGPTVFGRRFKSDATPIGGRIQVQAGAGYDAAIGGQGNFVLVWQVPDSSTQEDFNVFARRFKSNGAPLGPQVRVNEHTKGSQSNASVGIGTDGGFTVVWQSRPAESVSDVFARLFERK